MQKRRDNRIILLYKDPPPIPDKGSSSFHQMKDIDVQVSGIEKLLGNINPHKAKGPDEIHGRVLKECRKIIAPILTIIFQKSLISGKNTYRLETCQCMSCLQEG